VEKISVTFTLTPSASTLVMAGMPSTVAGIFTIRLGRSTVFHRSSASATVASVSPARRGSTSSDTRPSTPFVDAYTSRNRSHAVRTSVVVISLTVASVLAPRAASSRTCSS
jgi:hypothetical protein